MFIWNFLSNLLIIQYSYAESQNVLLVSMVWFDLKHKYLDKKFIASLNLNTRTTMNNLKLQISEVSRQKM